MLKKILIATVLVTSNNDMQNFSCKGSHIPTKLNLDDVAIRVKNGNKHFFYEKPGISGIKGKLFVHQKGQISSFKLKWKTTCKDLTTGQSHSCRKSSRESSAKECITQVVGKTKRGPADKLNYYVL